MKKEEVRGFEVVRGVISPLNTLKATKSKRASKEKRNKEIVKLSKQGLSTREIAKQVGLNQSTVVRILKNV